ncbi:hypothetical protein B0H11DRAFT_2108092 [Mycena galericulata]|nr:hypothetical protein B0H11DRAFT_2108092 [Mycena galericulata]
MSPALSLLALALFASGAKTVSALSGLQGPSSPPVQGANVSVTWSSDSSDTTPLTLALFNTDTGASQTFNGGLAVLNTVNPQANQATFEFPQVSPGTYILAFLSPTNTSSILASSPSFSISSSSSPTSPTTTGTGGINTSPVTTTTASAITASSTTVSGSGGSGSHTGSGASVGTSAGASGSGSKTATAPLSSLSASALSALSSLASASSSITSNAASVASALSASSVSAASASSASASPSKAAARRLGVNGLVMGGVVVLAAAF